MLDTAKRFHHLFRYDDFTGLLIRRCNQGNQFRGTIAGVTNRRLYAFVYVDNRCLAVHRVIWSMMRGPIPDGKVIDHIDGNRFNNRLSNLRLVSKATNNRNQRRRTDNTSGITGVWECPNSPYPWRAHIAHMGKNIRLGCFRTKEEAIAARKDANVRFGFHENHGRAA